MTTKRIVILQAELSLLNFSKKLDRMIWLSQQIAEHCI